MRWNFVRFPELQVAGCHLECETALDVQVISSLMSSEGELFSHFTYCKTGNFYFFHCPLASYGDSENFESWKKNFHKAYARIRANTQYWRSKYNGNTD